MARAGSDFAFSSSGFAFSSSGQLGPRLDSRTSSSNTPKSSKKRLGRARARARAQARSAPSIFTVHIVRTWWATLLYYFINPFPCAF